LDKIPNIFRLQKTNVFDKKTWKNMGLQLKTGKYCRKSGDFEVNGKPVCKISKNRH
jgi:hypothetical protein